MEGDGELSVGEALRIYYRKHGLPSDGGRSSNWFSVRVGLVRFSLPNPRARKRALLFHDLHHIATGYNTVFSAGEMEIAGWEVGAGCGTVAIAWFINLWMWALGLFFTPRRLFAAFTRGRACRTSLYRRKGARDALLSLTVRELREHLGVRRPARLPTASDWGLFLLWSVLACLLVGAHAVGLYLGVLFSASLQLPWSGGG